MSSIEPGLLLTPETLMPCPECGTTCPVGVRAAGTLVIDCPKHGAVVVTRTIQPRMIGIDRMDPEERLWVLETAIRSFLISPADEDFLVVQSMTLQCNYAQLRFNEGTLWGEVSSRQWDCVYCGNRPLDEEQEIFLNELGFVGGGSHRNFERRALPVHPRDLALLLERALVAAFNERPDFAIAIHPSRRETLRSILAALAVPGPISG